MGRRPTGPLAHARGSVASVDTPLVREAALPGPGHVSGQRPPAKVFISYSHRDRAALERLQVHLKPLEREGLVERWDDTRIQSGGRWKDEIRDALATARVAVLLVSADFLASDFIAAEELPPLLEAERARGLVILPVILGPCRYNETPSLAQFQAVNNPARPLSKMRKPEREAVWVKLVNDIEKALGRPVRSPRGVSPAIAARRHGFSARPRADRDSIRRLVIARQTRRGSSSAGRSHRGVLCVVILVQRILGDPDGGRKRSGGESPKTSVKSVEAKAPPAPAAAVLAGYVIDAETGELLPGVTLTIQDWDTLDGQTPTTTTDDAGRFRFDNLRPSPDPARLVRLVARKAGYEPSSTDPPLGTTTQTIKLRPATTTETDP